MTKWTATYRREYMRTYMQRYTQCSRWTKEYRREYMQRYRDSMNYAQYQQIMKKKRETATELQPLQIEQVPQRYFIQPGDCEGDIAHKKRLFIAWCKSHCFEYAPLPGMGEKKTRTRTAVRYDRTKAEQARIIELHAEVERLLKERDNATTSAAWCEINNQINNLRVKINNIQHAQ